MYRLLMISTGLWIPFSSAVLAQSPRPEWAQVEPVSEVQLPGFNWPARDVVFAEDTIFILTYDGDLHAVLESRDLSAGEVQKFRTERPTSLVRRSGEWWAWDPTTGGLSRGTDTDPETFVEKDLEDLVAGTYRVDGPARSNHLARLGPSGLVLERRQYSPQREGLTTQGAIVVAQPGDPPVEDTVLQFDAWSFSKDKEGLILCCGNPALFTPQANWDVFQSRYLFFTDGVQRTVVRHDLIGTRSDSVTTHAPPAPELSEDLMLEATIVASTESRAESFDHQQYRRRLRQMMEFLPQEFSQRLPTHTQLFALGEAEAIVRHFHALGPMGGLASEWSLVRFPRGPVLTVNLEGLGRVRAMRLNGNVLVVLHEELENGQYRLLISRFRVTE